MNSQNFWGEESKADRRLGFCFQKTLCVLVVENNAILASSQHCWDMPNEELQSAQWKKRHPSQTFDFTTTPTPSSGLQRTRQAQRGVAPERRQPSNQ